MTPHRPPPSIATALAVLLGIALTASASAQTTYRWIDRTTGQTVYSDQPPPPGVRYTTQGSTRETETSEAMASDAPSSPSYAVRQAAAKYPVVLYTAAHCTEPCQQARSLLNGRGVPFSEKLLTSPEEAAEIARQMGNETFVPGLKVGSQTFPGFEAGSWNNLLDLAGYPKTAPYGSKPSGALPR